MRAICIHAHFYQPPREDPWLDEVLRDPTAAPSHDWNARINTECYRPNRAARLVDTAGRLVHIGNNYRYLSFNVGPTLHRWIERHDAALNLRIREADEEAARETGAGGAIAQAYNHMILPLANARDLRTQVFWGIADFRRRFGRMPLGMWLPECAVNTASLEELAAANIRFCILAPGQCAAVRELDGQWRETPGGHGLDVTRPYRMALPSGREITLIFYHGGIAHDIAFGGLLDNGDRFAHALADAIPGNGEPRLLVVATDGESYGHHHRYGEMALTQAFHILSSSRDCLLSNVAAFLQQHPAEREARIVENSSWSCAHGIERWRSDCGCSTGGFGYHQRWRGPLRKALDNLRSTLDTEFEKAFAPFTALPWKLRDEAANIVTGEELPAAFLEARLGKLDPKNRNMLLRHLEAQKMGMFMYTSCGWFFNDVAGIETAQIIAYALRAVELLRSTGGPDLENSFRNDLEKAEGNRRDMPNGAAVLDKMVIPQRRTLAQIAASVLLWDKEQWYAFKVEKENRVFSGGDLSLRFSSLTVRDSRTEDCWQGSGVSLSSGGLGEVCRLKEGEAPSVEPLRRLFYEGDLLELSRQTENLFPDGPWRLGVLPQDEREAIVRERSLKSEARMLGEATEILEENKRLLVQLAAIGVPPPPFLQAAAELALKGRLQSILEDNDNDLTLLDANSPLSELLEEAHTIGVVPDLSPLAPRIEILLHDGIALEGKRPNNGHLTRLLQIFSRVRALGIELDLWRAQNEMWRLLEHLEGTPDETVIALAKELGFASPASRDR